MTAFRKRLPSRRAVAARVIPFLLVAVRFSGARAQGGEPAAPEAGAADAASGATVEARLESPPAHVTVGDPLTLVLIPRAPAHATLRAGSLDPDAFRPFHLLSVEERQDGGLALHLAPADTGSLQVPSVAVEWHDASGHQGTASTPAVPVEVASVLVEGQTDLADIRPPAEVRTDWMKLAPAAGAIAAALAALVAAVIWWKRRVPPERALPGLDTLSREDPWEWVRAALDRLVRAGLLEKQEMRPYCIRLSEIAREYLERRYRIPALERTTGEIAGELERALLAEPLRVTMTQVLYACDEVKFAGRAMRPEEGRGLASELALCLEKTRPAPALPAEPRPAAAGPAGAA